METRKETVGIYRIYAEKTGESYVGFSRHIEGTFKRLRFELTLNACSYKPLQAFWNEHGELKMEILEECHLVPTQSDEEHEGYLKARMFYHIGRLGAKAVQVPC